MKNIITIHIILCGLLSNTMIASERNTYSAIVIANEIHTANMSQSNNSPQSSSPIPIVPRKYSSSSFNSSHNSSSSPKSPKFREELGRSLSPRSSFSGNSISPSLSSSSTDNSTLIKNFFVESNDTPKKKYYLMQEDGKLNNRTYITDEDKAKYMNYYEAQLIITNNETSVKTICMTHPRIPFEPTEHQSSIKTNVTNMQIKELQKLPENKKIFASDDLKNLYYILSCVDNSTENKDSISSMNTKEQNNQNSQSTD